MKGQGNHLTPIAEKEILLSGVISSQSVRKAYQPWVRMKRNNCSPSSSFIYCVDSDQTIRNNQAD
jgi:hypothetical protein